jgi:FkbM family methyltransferase
MKLPRLLQLLPVPVLRGPARGKWWTLYPYTAYWRLGGHEPEMDLAIRLAGDLQGKTVWDLGAHFGIYSLVSSCLVGPHGQVVAFEPDAASFRRLQRHMRMNKASNVVLLHAAASDKNGEDIIVVDAGSGATTSHLLYLGEEVVDGTRTQAIECWRADDLVTRGKIRDAHFIKLDVEGHGAAAMRGAALSIGRSRPFIVASMHSPDEIDGIRAVLDPLGYRPERFGEAGVEECRWDQCLCGMNYLLRCRVS